MANSLNRNIEKGEEIVVDKKYLVGNIDPIFICESGFGMSGFKVGKAIYGKWKATGEEDRIEGFMIDAKKTAKHQQVKK